MAQARSRFDFQGTGGGADAGAITKSAARTFSILARHAALMLAAWCMETGCQSLCDKALRISESLVKSKPQGACALETFSRLSFETSMNISRNEQRVLHVLACSAPQRMDRGMDSFRHAPKSSIKSRGLAEGEDSSSNSLISQGESSTTPAHSQAFPRMRSFTQFANASGQPRSCGHFT